MLTKVLNNVNRDFFHGNMTKYCNFNSFGSRYLNMAGSVNQYQNEQFMHHDLDQLQVQKQLHLSTIFPMTHFRLKIIIIYLAVKS